MSLIFLTWFCLQPLAKVKIMKEFLKYRAKNNQLIFLQPSDDNEIDNISKNTKLFQWWIYQAKASCNRRCLLPTCEVWKEWMEKRNRPKKQRNDIILNVPNICSAQTIFELQIAFNGIKFHIFALVTERDECDVWDANEKKGLEIDFWLRKSLKKFSKWFQSLKLTFMSSKLIF